MLLVVLPVGVWAGVLPGSFFEQFPSFGRAWVSGDGPFNEHLLRDVGSLDLALAVVLAYALVSPTLELVRAAALATLVGSGLHFAYHVAHLDLLPSEADGRDPDRCVGGADRRRGHAAPRVFLPALSARRRTGCCRRSRGPGHLAWMMTRRHLVRFGGGAAIIAAVLRAVGSVVPASSESAALASLYLVTDLFIVLGLTGWYIAQHEHVGVQGLLGFVLGVVGVCLIRSSGSFPGMDLYSIGAPLLVIGLIVLAASAWRAGLMAVWVPAALLAAALIGPVGYLVPGASALFAASGLAFSIGFGGAGAYVWRAGVAPAASVSPQASLS